MENATIAAIVIFVVAYALIISEKTLSTDAETRGPASFDVDPHVPEDLQTRVNNACLMFCLF